MAVMLLVIAAICTSTQVSNIQSAMRAFVDEEGNWAKAHRGAYQAFIKFQHSQNPLHFEAFIDHLTFNKGVAKAKKQLDAHEFEQASLTLQEIGCDPYNIEQIIYLTRYFSWLQESQRAFKIWDKANEMVNHFEHMAMAYRMEPSALIKKQLLADISSTQQDMLKAEQEFDHAFIRLAEQTDNILSILTIIIFSLLGIIMFTVIKKVMNQITEKDELYQATFNKSQLAYVQFHLNGNLIDGNQQFMDLIKCNEIMLKSLNFFDILKNQGNPSHLISMKSRNKHQEFQFKLAANGSNRYFKAHATLIHNYSGTPLYFVAAIYDISKEKAQNRALKKLAHQDYLTGLMNRFAFENKLSELIKNQAYGYLLYMDLNGFKSVNDAAGHMVGDQILEQVAQKIRMHIRQNDLLARMGGDEFALFLENVTLKKATEIALNIRHALSSQQFVYLQNQFDISISIGISALTQGHKSIPELLSQADEACYVSKIKNRIVTYQSLAQSA